jgi:hypothetical protein
MLQEIIDVCPCMLYGNGVAMDTIILIISVRKPVLFPK